MSIFGTSGLIKANLKAYFKARKKGLDVDKALAHVIKSRYPLSERKRREVEQMFRLDLGAAKTESEKIKKLVLAILLEEYPGLEFSEPKFGKNLSIKPSALQQAEFQLNEIYNSMQRKYKL